MSKKEYIELLPCPFCRGKADIEPDYWTAAPSAFCQDCGVMTPDGDTREETAKIWNTRIAND